MAVESSRVLDLLITREHDAPDGSTWRLHFAPNSMVPGVFHGRVVVDGTRREVYPVRYRGFADFHSFMWDSDSTYEGNETADGGLCIVAKGRSTITMPVWLASLVRDAS